MSQQMQQQMAKAELALPSSITLQIVRDDFWSKENSEAYKIKLKREEAPKQLSWTAGGGGGARRDRPARFEFKTIPAGRLRYEGTFEVTAPKQVAIKIELHNEAPFRFIVEGLENVAVTKDDQPYDLDKVCGRRSIPFTLRGTYLESANNEAEKTLVAYFLASRWRTPSGQASSRDFCGESIRHAKSDICFKVSDSKGRLIILVSTTAHRLTYAISLVGIFVLVASAQQRRWTDSTGKYSVDAEFVEVKVGTVAIRRSSGKTVAVPLARLSTLDRKYVAEQEAVAIIKQLDGEVDLQPPRYMVSGVRLNGPAVTDRVFETIKEFGELEWIDLSTTKITDAGLQHLSGLPQLRQLELNECQITDAGLEHIKGLKTLSILSLDGTQITDAGLMGVMELTSLSHLHLNGTQITDNGLERIDGLKRLSMLYLRDTQVTDATLERLQQLNRLGLLELSGTRITDEGLKNIKGLKRLTFLIISNTQVTDAGLQHLRALPELNFLNLSNTQVTDAGMPHLSAMPKLLAVRIINTNVTDAGVKTLERPRRIGVELVTRPKSDEDLTWLSQLAELDYLSLPNLDDSVEKDFVYSLLLRTHTRAGKYVGNNAGRLAPRGSTTVFTTKICQTARRRAVANSAGVLRAGVSKNY